jgi:hypothetical protein
VLDLAFFNSFSQLFAESKDTHGKRVPWGQRTAGYCRVGFAKSKLSAKSMPRGNRAFVVSPTTHTGSPMLGNSGKPVTLETSGFDKVLEACFSGTASSRFSEAWNLRSLGFANV